MRHALITFALALLSWSSGTAVHATDYDEAVQGELSGERLNPNRLVLSYGTSAPNGLLGNNILTGTLGRSAAGVIDRDYLTVVIPVGFQLTSLRAGQQTTVGGSGSFIGLAAGATVGVDPVTAATADGLLGYRIYTAADRGADILAPMSIPFNGSSGFDVPLSAGEYTLWLQELSTGSFTYRFNLQLAPVPEAGTRSLTLCGLALIIAGALRRGRLC